MRFSAGKVFKYTPLSFYVFSSKAQTLSNTVSLWVCGKINFISAIYFHAMQTIVIVRCLGFYILTIFGWFRPFFVYFVDFFMCILDNIPRIWFLCSLGRYLKKLINVQREEKHKCQGGGVGIITSRIGIIRG